MNEMTNENKNQIQFEKIIKKLKDARLELDVNLHLKGLSELIENQDLILRTCIFEPIEFEFFYDLIYDYGPTLCSNRDEALIFKSAIKWLTYTEYCDERKVLIYEIMNLINFDDMNESELQQSFNYFDTYRIPKSLKGYLGNIWHKMIVNRKLKFHESSFVDCVRI